MKFIIPAIIFGILASILGINFTFEPGYISSNNKFIVFILLCNGLYHYTIWHASQEKK